jgi:hypothetical protein
VTTLSPTQVRSILVSVPAKQIVPMNQTYTAKGVPDMARIHAAKGAADCVMPACSPCVQSVENTACMLPQLLLSQIT